MTMREPPHDDEAEQQLLGAILLNQEAFHRVSGRIKPEHFYREEHAKCFAAIAKLVAEGRQANVVTVAKVPGQSFDYLKTLMASSIGWTFAPDFAESVHDLYLRRGLASMAEKLLNEATDGGMAVRPKQLIEDAEATLAALTEAPNMAEPITDLNSAAVQAIDTVAEAYRVDEGMAGLPTGFADLDRKLGGLAPSDLIILAGRPSMGKTALATGIAYGLADAKARGVGGCDVGFFSLEMSAEQLAMRLIAEQSGIPSFRLRAGDISQREFDELLVTVEAKFNNKHLHIDETGRLTIDQLVTRARRMKRKHNIGLLIVDYLQLVTGSKRTKDRHLEVGEITTGLKALAKDLRIPIMALSQLSRQVETRGEDKRPQLSDLRESGSVEQDADVVLFVFREEYYLAASAVVVTAGLPEKEKKAKEAQLQSWEAKMRVAKGKAEIIIGKQRHGPIGTVEVTFEARLTKFGNVPKQEVFAA